ncbi:MAG TPA: hypothetical protein VN325_08995 [Steroidobacteraceae bacterium]|nr:hypothetical protein [Steroidobacteraceae bacterium]
MGNSPRCLEFAILSAARTSEALTAQWTEFDRQARTWTIPAKIPRSIGGGRARAREIGIGRASA